MSLSKLQPFVPIPGSSNSPQCLRRARNWLSICKETHTKCRKEVAISKCVPKRLLEIEGKIVKLRVDVASKHDYVALSYCWGQAPHLKTESQNIEVHKNGIPITALPRTLQDAIKITRLLKFRYIWIDSMCIVQDSVKDWAEQSSQMAFIYGNAELVLGATVSSSSQSGFLGHRQSVFDDKLAILLKGCRLPTTFRYRIYDLTGARGALQDRAWTFQEQLVARRYLGYGINEIVWSCLESDRCECDCVSDISLYIDSPLDQHLRNITRSLASANKDKIWWIWRHKILSTYSARGLTVPNDILVALSAIATVFQAKTGATYSAGLWKEDLVQGLTWRFGTMGTPQPFYTPSWSWASVNNRWLLHWDSHDVRLGLGSWTELASITEFNAPSISTNPFELVSHGAVKLRGMSTRAQLLYSSAQRTGKLKLGNSRIYIDLPLLPSMAKLSDGTVERTLRRAEFGEKIESHFDSYGLKEFTVWLLVLLSKAHDAYDALILVRVASRGTDFQRIGIVELWDSNLEGMECQEFTVV